ncbi:hypothetical protein RISK_003112 [Rhodopirellula islandica]|uniref:Uncharacterized protein n=1 Tax=Rhodopirellula islandica TaxID=595434 RepID=A0A0J1EH26_RHOIS|nr:hypothetical protein RISK_003112 [Rhodopirellula islandica]
MRASRSSIQDTALMGVRSGEAKPGRAIRVSGLIATHRELH